MLSVLLMGKPIPLATFLLDPLILGATLGLLPVPTMGSIFVTHAGSHELSIDRQVLHSKIRQRQEVPFP